MFGDTQSVILPTSTLPYPKLLGKRHNAALAYNDKAWEVITAGIICYYHINGKKKPACLLSRKQWERPQVWPLLKALMFRSDEVLRGTSNDIPYNKRLTHPSHMATISVEGSEKRTTTDAIHMTVKDHSCTDNFPTTHGTQKDISDKSKVAGTAMKVPKQEHDCYSQSHNLTYTDFVSNSIVVTTLGNSSAVN